MAHGGSSHPGPIPSVDRRPNGARRRPPTRSRVTVGRTHSLHPLNSDGLQPPVRPAETVSSAIYSIPPLLSKTARLTPSGRAARRQPHLSAPPRRLKLQSLRSFSSLTRLRSAPPHANPAGRRHPPPAAPPEGRRVFPAPRGNSTPPPPSSRLAHCLTRPASAALRPRLFAPRRPVEVQSLRSFSSLTRLRSAHPTATGLRAAPAVLGDDSFREEGRVARWDS